MQIDWIPPEPRSGVAGALDRFIGPGATTAEIVVQFTLALAIAAVAMSVFQLTRESATHPLALLVLLLIAIDMGGGIATNATSAAKRWYHRPGQGPLRHLGFVAVHGLHVLAVALLFVPSPWLYAGTAYAALLAGAAAIVFTPLYLQRPVALSFVGLAVVAANVPPFDEPGLSWFLPLLALKLWAAHLLREAPFRP